MKVRFWDKGVVSIFARLESLFLTCFSIAAIFIPFDKYTKKWALFSLFFISICLYFAVVLFANKTKIVKIRIRNTRVVIKEGDLFKEHGKKVVPCNDLFSTQVDDIIVAKGSIHGQFILNCVLDIDKLKAAIKEQAIKRHIKILIDQEKEPNDQIRFNVGTIIPFEEYLLLAYSKFDNENKASLKGDSFSKCYTSLWKEIDKFRAAESICLPVLGAGGIVRFDQNYSAQQLLEMMLWSFRISGVNLARQATLTIVVHKSTSPEINFWRLKSFSN